MGYTVITKIGEVEYRYTEWVDFNTENKYQPNWNRNVGVELYDHNNDIGENFNIAGNEDKKDIVA